MNKKFDIAVDAYNSQEDFSYRYNGLPKRVQEKIDSGEILENPMTSPDDIIKGGSDGLAERLGAGLPGQVLKVGDSGLEYGDAGGQNQIYIHSGYMEAESATYYHFTCISTIPTAFTSVEQLIASDPLFLANTSFDNGSSDVLTLISKEESKSGEYYAIGTLDGELREYYGELSWYTDYVTPL